MSPTTDDLRRLLDERASTPLPDDLDPLRAATGPRLAGVHERVRRARRRRAAGVAATAAAALAVTALAVPAVLRPTTTTDRTLPAATTVPGTLDADGLPPTSDPWGRPLRAATTVDAAGPREQSVRILPTAAGDAGFSVLVHCTGGAGAHVAWIVGDKVAGTVPCGADRGATFSTRTVPQWRAFGVTPDRPVVVRLRIVGAPVVTGAPAATATGPVAPSNALVAVYADDAGTTPPGTDPATDPVAGTPADPPVLLDPVRDVYGATSSLLGAVSLAAGNGPALRVFRVRPQTLDGMVLAVGCRERPDALRGRALRLSVDARAFADLGCENSDGTSPATWPDGDAGRRWRGYDVPEDTLVTVVVSLPSRPGSPSAGRVEESVPDVVDVGVYGTAPPAVEPPGARAAALALLQDPPAEHDGHPLLATMDLTAATLSRTRPAAGRYRAFDVHYQCVGSFRDLVVVLERDAPSSVPDSPATSETEVTCGGEAPLWTTLEVRAESGPLTEGTTLTASLVGRVTAASAMPPSVVVRVAFYGIP
ncbi:hypothetical protein [Kineosporia sp. A_224]|uniref:hypothetical protein n=1 Tax=Kineosporia sp. A_224 TaxID=1962180 RepID=UPI000B4B7050|nr:hypothetical protein [Kineosporia sp. A_224]